MIVLSNSEIVRCTENVARAYGSGQGAPLPFEKFSANVNQETLEALQAAHKDKPLYPMTIKIPKAQRYLKDGDFTPAQIIMIEEPIKGYDGAPVWYANSGKGVILRFGYVDGDKRYPSTTMFGDAIIHGLLAGATGQGKSVALNNLIYNIAREYAPWEVDLSFCDAKITEGKTIANTAPVPHIRAVAATSDTDYIVSILRKARQEMMERMSFFNRVDAKKIEEFRKNTGLALPQVIIIIDETQAMFENAKKNKAASEELISIINDITKLGRSAGYHLLLASQELGDSIPSAAMRQMSLRCALGCQEAVSNAILGNTGAVEYFNKKGNLVVNLGGVTGSEADNVHYKVPLILQEQQIKVYEESKALCERFGYKYHLNAYDEDDYVREAKWLSYLSQFTADPYTVLLGEPSFVTQEKENILKIRFTGKDIENILVLSEQQRELLRLCKMLKYSFRSLKEKTRHFVVCVDPAYQDECKIGEIAEVFDTEKAYETNETLAALRYLVMKRKLAIVTDANTFQDAQCNEASDHIFYQAVEKGSVDDTEINRIRCYHMVSLLINSKIYHNWFDGLGAKNEAEVAALRVQLFGELLAIYNSFDSTQTQLVPSKFSPVFVWVLGLERMLGMGRSPKSNQINELKGVLQDCTEVNIRYFIFARTMEETGELRDAFGYYLMCDVSSQDQSRLKMMDTYPSVVRPVQAILYTKSESQNFKSKKFKKMIFDDENI